VPSVTSPAQTTSGFPPELVSFLQSSGFAPPSEDSLQRGGNNNRVQVVNSLHGGRAALKTYFRRTSDTKDRFGAERAFYTHAGREAPTWVARDLGWSEEARAALFEFVEGQRVGQVQVEDVASAGCFLNALQAGRKTASLPSAAEAAFDGSAHARVLDARLSQLAETCVEDSVSFQAQRFVLDELRPRWDAMRPLVITIADLPLDGRCVSPSDFGFHNAMRRTDGRLCFLDFEYAGVDDPAKLVCDFFWQPAVPVPWELLPGLLDAVGASLGPRAWLAERCRVLFPMFGLKWCCIVLNEFLRDGAARRDFSGGPGSSQARREAQLRKSRELLARVDEAIKASPVP
jgi:hypothetical protein